MKTNLEQLDELECDYVCIQVLQYQIQRMCEEIHDSANELQETALRLTRVQQEEVLAAVA